MAKVVVHEVELYTATKTFCESRGIGTTFAAADFDKQECPLTSWPQPDWRTVEDGVGGGTTEGTFECRWEDGSHYASNSGVAHGDYQFAFSTLEKAVENEKIATASATSSSRYIGYGVELPASDSLLDMYYCCTEINYHACGSQLFAAVSSTSSHERENEKDCSADFICLVALPPPDRAPDDVLPSDFIALFVPRGTGLSLGARVWHTPPIICGQTSAILKTKQARVHSKIYYHPLREHSTVLSVSCREVDCLNLPL
jgi:hypothetical protein